MCLPIYFYRDGRFKKNIGMFFSECFHGYQYHGHYRIKLLDSLILGSEKEKFWDIDNCVTGLPIDFPKYNKKYKSSSNITKKDEQTYTFYNISEDNDRKNLDDIVRSYYAAFTNRDNVRLVLKVNSNSNILQRIPDIKKETRAIIGDNWPEVVVINQWLSEDEINSMHTSSNCYVSTAHGESWCYPMLDAMMFRNRIISCQNMDYMRNISLSVNEKYTYCKSPNPPTQFHYSAYDKWLSVDTGIISDMMKTAYNKKEGTQISQELLHSLSNRYSYSAIGHKILSKITGGSLFLEY